MASVCLSISKSQNTKGTKGGETFPVSWGCGTPFLLRVKTTLEEEETSGFLKVTPESCIWGAGWDAGSLACQASDQATSWLYFQRACWAIFCLTTPLVPRTDFCPNSFSSQPSGHCKGVMAGDGEWSQVHLSQGPKLQQRFSPQCKCASEDVWQNKQSLI